MSTISARPTWDELRARDHGPHPSELPVEARYKRLWWAGMNVVTHYQDLDERLRAVSPAFADQVGALLEEMSLQCGQGPERWR
jgi:hypothetical protein